jgi:membrane fusion protein, multidrug efflux system
MNRIVTLTGLLALLYTSSCTSKKEEKEEAVMYVVTSPLEMDTVFTKEFVSQIQSIQNIELRAQEKGFLQNIFVNEGQAVKAGQVLFRIMPKMYEAELMKARAEAKGAEIELQNARTLADKNIVSRNEQSLAQSKLDAARAEIALAKLHLSFTDIRAPFDGIIDRIPKKLGSLIDEGELLTSLSDNSQMYAYFNVSEPEYLNYEQHKKDRPSDNVHLQLANGEIFQAKGEVEVIESEFNNETGTIAFRATFPNPDKLLRNGQTGKILMEIPVANAIIIPQKATYEIQDKTYVFVVDKNNVVHSQNITIRGEMPDIYVVESGLTKADKIVLEGVQKVKDDDKIRYKYEKPEEVISHLRLKAE